MNKNFLRLLNNAILYCGGLNILEFQKAFAKIFPFTTENISGYIKLFDLKDKSLLTVGSSGDQLINALLFNPRSITHFDINPYSKFYIYLKIAGILELDLNNFLNFFKLNNKSSKYVFNKQEFLKIKTTLRLLDYESYMFWNELFDSINPITVRKRLFDKYNVYEEDIITNCNLYLKSNINYKEVREKISKTNLDFINGNILDANLESFYDNIWLSNILYYLVKEKVEIMVNNCKKYLNENGKILISYLYNTDEYTKRITNWNSGLSIIDEFNERFSSNIFFFPGMNGLSSTCSYNKDAVLIYTKNNN